MSDDKKKLKPSVIVKKEFKKSDTNHSLKKWVKEQLNSSDDEELKESCLQWFDNKNMNV